MTLKFDQAECVANEQAAPFSPKRCPRSTQGMTLHPTEKKGSSRQKEMARKTTEAKGAGYTGKTCSGVTHAINSSCSLAGPRLVAL